MPALMGASRAKGIDVRMQPIRKRGPMRGLMMEPCLPSSPNPALSAMGICKTLVSPMGCSTVQCQPSARICSASLSTISPRE